MPELPEVETVARWLRQGGRALPDGSVTPSIVGAQIRSLDVRWARTLAMPTAAEAQLRLPGQTIREIGRRGKYLVLSLDRDTLLFHLRMSGDLSVAPSVSSPAPHDRLLIDFASPYRLVFNDPRKFGRVWLTGDPQTVLGGLGPEPLAPDFTPADLHARLQAHRRQLKTVLLDQSVLAGLGNIYTDEALHRARLHPLRLSHTLTGEETERLWAAIRQVLTEGIQGQGASIDWVYRGGAFQNSFRAYQQTGKPCPVCGTPIQRIVVGQRGTHFCPVCQPLPEPPVEDRKV